MIESIELFGDTITFSEKQSEYLSTIFNDDLSLADNHYKEMALFGGFRSGKSYVTQLSIFLLCCIYPGLRVVYVRRTYDQLKDSVIAQFKNDFAKYGKFDYIDSSKDGSRIAKFNNGSTIRFRAFDRDTNILSAEYDVAAMCQAEEIQEELYLQLWGRLSGRTMHKAILLAEGNPANSWCKRLYKDSKPKALEEKGIYFNNITTKDNPFLTPDYVQELERSYPDRWLRRYVYGEWESVDEMVFSEFRESKHVIEPIHFNPKEYKTFKIAMGGDYGYRNPAAFLWGYKDYDDNVIIFDEWYKNEQQPMDIRQAGLKYGRYPIYYDFSIKRPDRDGRCLWDELKAPGLDRFGRKIDGLNLIESNKDEMRNLTVTNSMFKQGKLYVTRNCVNLIQEILNYKWQSIKLGAEKNDPEKPVDKDNHAIDSLLYLIAGMRVKKSLHPEIIANKKSLKTLNEKPEQRSAVDYG